MVTWLTILCQAGLAAINSLAIWGNAPMEMPNNTRSKSIGKAKAAGEDIAPLIAEMDDIGAKLEEAKVEFKDIQDQLNNFFASMPNLPDDAVPEGLSKMIMLKCLSGVSLKRSTLR